MSAEYQLIDGQNKKNETQVRKQIIAHTEDILTRIIKSIQKIFKFQPQRADLVLKRLEKKAFLIPIVDMCQLPWCTFQGNMLTAFAQHSAPNCLITATMSFLLICGALEPETAAKVATHDKANMINLAQRDLFAFAQFFLWLELDTEREIDINQTKSKFHCPVNGCRKSFVYSYDLNKHMRKYVKTRAPHSLALVRAVEIEITKRMVQNRLCVRVDISTTLNNRS